MNNNNIKSKLNSPAVLPGFVPPPRVQVPPVIPTTLAKELVCFFVNHFPLISL